MTPFKVIFEEPLHPAGWQRLEQAPEVTLHGPCNSYQELMNAARSADALIVGTALFVDAQMLKAAPQLKVICIPAPGYQAVDIESATRNGVLVINSPQAAAISLAEFTYALLLTLVRRLHTSLLAACAPSTTPESLFGMQLYGRNLALVGFDSTAREIARRAQAFGMNVLVSDTNLDLASAHSLGVESLGLQDLLKAADILSFHTSRSERSDYLLDAEHLSLLKPDVYLVSCLGQPLADEHLLLQALDRGLIAGIALDHSGLSKNLAGSHLADHPRVILSPGLGQMTIEAQRDSSIQIVEDLLAALRDEDYRNTVNLPFNQQTSYRAARQYIHLAEKMGKLQGQLAEGWITRLEVELLGQGMQEMVRPVTATLLSGMLRPPADRTHNWVSAPVLAHEQGIKMSQVKGLVQLADYPNLIACRVCWDGGQRTVAGVLFGNGEARLVQYDHFHVDAYPEGYVLILDNEDVPGVIGKVGTRLGRAGINIAQWRYGREYPGGRAVSFINLDSRAPHDMLLQLEEEAEIHRARLVKL